MTTPILSIVILNFNSGSYLKKCLESLEKSQTNYPFEVIVVDNASTDKSANLSLKKFKLSLKIINNKKNTGFSAGNNFGIKKTFKNSKYLLFLNPDTIVMSNTIQKIVSFMEKNPDISASTCQIILAKTGLTQPECHRGFPTPWRSFCYFSGLSKIFPKSKFFSGYLLGHLDFFKTHPIEACVGAFILIERKAGEVVDWWNESYFFYGEDLDLCFNLFKNNFKLYYYPHCQITHYQGVSSGIKNQSKHITKASRQTKILSAKSSTQAMRIFYQQNYFKNYNFLVKFLVNTGINILEFIRVFKAKYL